ncbi:MAG: glycosyltransferase, partial [Phycisphaerales bacterium JB059]
MTILLPVSRAGPELEGALESVTRQTLPPREVLLVLNGSDKPTRDRAHALAQESEPVRIIELPEANLAAALNRGLEEARTELVARMDADDRSWATRLERQADTMTRRPELSAIGCAYEVQTPEGRRLGVVRPPTDEREARWRLLLGNVFAHGSMMLRRSRVLGAGGYNPDKRRAQDYDLWLRLGRGSPCLAALPETLYTLRRAEEADAFASTPEQGTHASASLLEAWRALDGEDERVPTLLASVLTRNGQRQSVGALEALLRERPTREGLTAWLLAQHTSPSMPRAAHDACRRARLREVGAELRERGVTSLHLWGAGEHSAWVLAHENDLGVEIEGIVDDAQGVGVRFGFEVASPETLRPGQSALL